MRRSLRNRSLLLLLALVATLGALTSPVAAQYCYFLEAQSCYYWDSGGYCYYSCPSVSYCYGELSGAPTCYPEGIVCCY